MDLWLDFHINEDFQYHMNGGNIWGKKNKKKEKNLFPQPLLSAVARSNQGYVQLCG